MAQGVAVTAGKRGEFGTFLQDRRVLAPDIQRRDPVNAIPGNRFEILQAGGELAEIVFEREPDDILRTSAPAIILRTGDQLSASGVISNGTDDLDITIDIGTTTTVDEARRCTPADRL